ncbi:unnamed protein product, partial [Cyprideis torosa]
MADFPRRTKPARPGPGGARAAAAKVVSDVVDRGRSLDVALAEHVSPTMPDRAFAQQLSYGTLRWYGWLKSELDPLIYKPLPRSMRQVEALLLVGLYQIEFARLPEHAAVSSTVEAVDALGAGPQRALMNGVLRNYLRRREPVVEAQRVRFSWPSWIVGEYRKSFGREGADAALAAGNGEPPMTLRVSLSRVSRDAYRGELAEAGIEATDGTLSPAALYLAQAVNVDRLPRFAEGVVAVQDEAAQLAALALAPITGERVADLCAAPGGKSAHLLDIAPDLGLLLACDIDSERLKRVAERLGESTPLQLREGDAADPALLADDPLFDAILVDAPCSGLGVVRRHPDIKHLR